MARYPLAAKALIAEVKQHKPRTKAKPVGDPDGLNVHRTVVFNKEAGNWLEPLLEIANDRRIASWEKTKDGLEVTFVATVRADTKDSFGLDEAEEIKASLDGD